MRCCCDNILILCKPRHGCDHLTGTFVLLAVGAGLTVVLAGLVPVLFSLVPVLLSVLLRLMLILSRWTPHD